MNFDLNIRMIKDGKEIYSIHTEITGENMRDAFSEWLDTVENTTPSEPDIDSCAVLIAKRP